MVILLILARLEWKQLQIGTDILLIITSTSDMFLRSVNIDDLEWPWNPKIGFLVNFLRFWAATHILRVNCAEMAGERPGQPTCEIFSIERTFLTTKVTGPLLSRVTWVLLKLLVYILLIHESWIQLLYCFLGTQATGCFLMLMKQVGRTKLVFSRASFSFLILFVKQYPSHVASVWFIARNSRRMLFFG